MGPTIRAMTLLALLGICAAGAAAQDATGPDLQSRGPYVGIAGGPNFQQVNRSAAAAPTAMLDMKPVMSGCSISVTL
jgi:hypothetical protein